MSGPSPQTGASPGDRVPLPPGGARALSRAYLLFALLAALLLLGAGALTVAGARSVGRGHPDVLPALLAGAGATVGLLLLIVAAFTGRAAISGGLVDPASTTRVVRTVRVAQAMVVAGALAALVSGVLRAVGGGGTFPLWLALGVGVPVAALVLFAGSLNRLARAAVGHSTPR